MSKHECDCCRVYGPIPREGISDEERRRIKKELRDAMKRFEREDPEGFKELQRLLANVSSHD